MLVRKHGLKMHAVERLHYQAQSICDSDDFHVMTEHLRVNIRIPVPER